METGSRKDAEPVAAGAQDDLEQPGSAGSEAHANMPDLERVLTQGYSYNFFKLVHFLERTLPGAAQPGGRFDPRQDRIRFRPDSSVVFPATDVKRVEWNGHHEDPVTVVVSFMGLYGFDAAMPAAFHRDIAQDLPSARPLRDFLDIFNHRLYSFFYRAWKKYRPQHRTGSEVESDAVRFLSIGGLGTSNALSTSPIPALRLAAFAGQLASRVRNANGLKNLITGCMPDYSVEIRENVPRWVYIEDRPRLGSGRPDSEAVLGSSATIGTRILDASGKFRVVLGPLVLEQFESCLPGGEDAGRLDFLVGLYLADALDYDIRLLLHSNQVPRMVLGQKKRRLGFNTWLGTPPEEVTERIVHYHRPIAA